MNIFNNRPTFATHRIDGPFTTIEGQWWVFTQSWCHAAWSHAPEAWPWSCYTHRLT